MIAADTNIVVRLLVQDDPDQAARARLMFEAETVFIPKTVILETEWVLRSLYRRPGADVASALAALIALPQVRCEDAVTVAQALAMSAQGLDFADALHLASSHGARRFATFDRTLVRQAEEIGMEIDVFSP